MTVVDIESWVRGGESETLELKRRTGERREAARAVRAMLDHRGGRVIFGVEPDGRMIGQMVSDRTVEVVAQDFLVMNSNSLQTNSNSTPIGRVEPWPPLGAFGIPTVSRQKCREVGATWQGGSESRQISRHVGGTQPQRSA